MAEKLRKFVVYSQVPFSKEEKSQNLFLLQTFLLWDFYAKATISFILY